MTGLVILTGVAGSLLAFALSVPLVVRWRTPRFPEPTVCPGSNVLVHEDTLDGNGVGTCTVCPRFIVAEPVAGHTWRVTEHQPGRIVKARLVEMARDQATDDAVDAHIEAREGSW